MKQKTTFLAFVLLAMLLSACRSGTPTASPTAQHNLGVDFDDGCKPGTDTGR